MTIEEKIKEIANKYAKTETIPSAGLILTARNAFVDGANFGRELGMKEAFEWRDVNIELPEAIKDGKSLPVLIKTKYGGYDVAVYDNYFSDFIANAMAVAGVTHWRPINQEDMP